MPDTIEKLGNSLIQHGPRNERIYLMKVSGQDLPDIIQDMERLADEHGYTKAFVKAPLQVKGLFRQEGYVEEARIPGFYYGTEDGVFLGKYFDAERSMDPHADKVQEILELARDKAAHDEITSPPEKVQFYEAAPDDAEAMTEVYKAVFDSYPFPIDDADYIRQTMQSHIRYFCGEHDGRIVALSSAEIDRQRGNVEMTDFATLPDYRGRGIARQLLTQMEQAMAEEPVQVFYTIARALSAGMNITFAQHGYEYGGTLVNNTNICGRIESMNVWCKDAAAN